MTSPDAPRAPSFAIPPSTLIPFLVLAVLLIVVAGTTDSPKQAKIEPAPAVSGTSALAGEGHHVTKLYEIVPTGTARDSAKLEGTVEPLKFQPSASAPTVRILESG